MVMTSRVTNESVTAYHCIRLGPARVVSDSLSLRRTRDGSAMTDARMRDDRIGRISEGWIRGDRISDPCHDCIRLGPARARQAEGVSTGRLDGSMSSDGRR
jgi:hypothetical protein